MPRNVSRHSELGAGAAAFMISVGLLSLGLGGQALHGQEDQAGGRADAKKSDHADDADPVDFRRQVAPIFSRRCLSCHNERQKKGDFQIQSESHLSASGYVEASDPESSHLLTVIQPQGGRAPQMPKDSDPLKPAEVAAIRQWIREGAKWPQGFVLQPAQVRDTNWWSLRPLNAVQPPAHVDAAGKQWIRSPIDAFIYAKLREKTLRPSPEADRRTLIRRLYYDLIGMPPTPKQVEAFVADSDPLAYEHLVDALLESPHYGERWARHWLDVVHYADTHGYDKDKLRPNAWPYRDYVIRSLNQDKPYSRFVKEQLAGDALWPDSSDGPVATGFIAAGPWDFIGHAEVPETKLDGKVARNLDRDNMVTSTMNTFCSLTVQCARCHHHKLDPVTMQDYYSLQAVFAALDRADRPYDLRPQTAKKRASLNQQLEQLEGRIAELQAEVDRRLTPKIKQLDAEIASLKKQTELAKDASSTKGEKRSNAYGYHSQVAAAADERKWVQLDLGAVRAIDTVFLFGADEYGFSDFGFPDRFVVEVAKTADFASPVVVADFRDQDVTRPGSSAFPISFASLEGRYIRVTATKLWSRRRKGQPATADWIFALGEMAVAAGGKLLRPLSVSAFDSIEAAPRWAKKNLIDGVYGGFTLDQRLRVRRASPSNGYHSKFAKESKTEKWIQLDLGRSSAVDSIELTPAFPTDWKDTPGFGFPIRFRIEASEQSDFSNTQVIVDHSQKDFPNPGLQRVVLPFQGGKVRYLRLTATRLWDRGGAQHALALAEFRVFHKGQPVSTSASVTASDSIESGRWSKANLIDGFTSRAPIDPRVEDLAALAVSSRDHEKLERLLSRRAALLSEAIGEKLASERRRTTTALRSLRAELAKLPKPAVVYAGVVHRGSGAFRGRAGLGPREIHVLHRGDLKHPGEIVAPGTTPFVPKVAARFELPKNAPEWRRRVALADWITHRDNPLTWRSIVNRIWLYHFGRGLVDTPNDFGRGGKRPTHPKLLDWLATHFRDNGQSIKSLHRLIVNSAVYRQVSAGDNSKSALDTDNQWYWRQNRRRLTAEEVRDSILLVSGKLNRQVGGPGFMDFVIEHPQHSPHYEYHKYDPNDVRTHRRAIYRFIVRSQPQPFMDTLDCADPSMSVPKRDETLTSLQALTLLNNRFVVSMAENFAQRLAASQPTVEGQVRLAYRLALAREADAEEVRLLAAYAKEHGAANACRLILNLNEFVFVD